MKTVFVIPMAGTSSRFFNAGYTTPKYELKIGQRSVFTWSLLTFAKYFKSAHFIFGFLDDPRTAEFIRCECMAVGLGHVTLVPIGAPTSGQAETCVLALKGAAVEPKSSVVIFNIDTSCPNWSLPSEFGQGDAYGGGFLDVFEGEGDGWSFVRPMSGDDCSVAETVEKRPISRLCCTGMYGFSTVESFLCAYEANPSARSDAETKERYVAPLYNVLIGMGLEIKYRIVPKSSVLFCGIPQEYEALVKEAL